MRSIRLFIVGIIAFTTACATSGQVSATDLTRLERSRQTRPNDAGVARRLGIAYYKAGRYPDARTQLTHAVRLDPRDGSAALYLGLTAEQQKDFATARAAYQGYVRYGRTSRVRRQLEARLAALTRQELQTAAKSAVAQEQQLGTRTGSPRTVAVMPLRFVGSDTTLQPLERGFAELLTTDLSRSSQLTVVERARIQALVDELRLQQAGMTDSTTNVRAGKIIQAGRIVSGQIVQNEQRLRVDAAIVNTTTSALAGGAANENTLEQLFAIEKAIVLQLFDSLGVTLTTAERNAIEQRPTRSLQAFLAYSKGLSLEDQGRFDEASRSFQDAARLDPSFTQAQTKSVQTANAAAGAQMSVVSIESSIANTSEGAAAQGGPGTGSGDNSAANTADNLNQSQAAGATDAAGATRTTATPQRDAVGASVGAESSTSSATVRIIFRLPRP
jgi:TolB-like protein